MSEVEYMEFPLLKTLEESIDPLNRNIKSVWEKWNIIAIDCQKDRLILRRYKLKQENEDGN